MEKIYAISMAKNPHHSSMGEANTLRQIPLHQGPITSAMGMWKYCRTEERVADMLTKDRIEIDLRNCDGREVEGQFTFK